MQTLTREHFLEVLDQYCDAWQTQDPEKILSLFTEDGIYHERVLEEPILGHAGIYNYWQSKVVENQANIQVRVVNAFIDGQVGIAEWEVFFDDREQSLRKYMKEIAILEFRDGKIKLLREYWASKPLGPIH